MSPMALSEAQATRNEVLLDQRLEHVLELSAKTVGPHVRAKLLPLLKYYAKKPHPFTACYRDNAKRFGPHGAAQVCATLKDIIRGTTKWRKGGQADHGSVLSDDTAMVDHGMPVIGDDVLDLVEQLTDAELHDIVYGGSHGEA